MIILRQKQHGLLGGLFNREGKKLKSEFENKFGMSPENYYSSNLPPKVDLGQVKRICSEIEKLNESYEKAVGKSKFDYLYFYSNVVYLELVDPSNCSNNILQGLIKNQNNIPIIDFACSYFEDIVNSGYISYNTRLKNFTCSAASTNQKPDTLKNNLLFVLEILLDTIESDVNENYYDDYEFVFNDMQEGFKFWKREYYEKAKNIIGQIRF